MAQTDRTDSPRADSPRDRGGQKKSAEGIKPYNEVITKEAKSDPGLFIVHRVKDRVYYEIPRTAIDKEMLWVTQIERTQAGHGYGGTSVGNRVVRWALRGEDVLLRDVKYTLRAGSEDAVANAVFATSMEPIIATLPVKAWGKDLAAVIEVTDLFKDDIPEFSAKRRLNASGSDKKRTFIEQIRSFPENIETKVLMTYKLSAQSRAGTRTPAPTPRRRRRGPRPDPSQGGVTVLLHHSMSAWPSWSRCGSTPTATM